MWPAIRHAVIAMYTEFGCICMKALVSRTKVLICWENGASCGRSQGASMRRFWDRDSTKAIFGLHKTNLQDMLRFLVYDLPATKQSVSVTSRYLSVAVNEILGPCVTTLTARHLFFLQRV